LLTGFSPEPQGKEFVPGLPKYPVNPVNQDCCNYRVMLDTGFRAEPDKNNNRIFRQTG